MIVRYFAEFRSSLPDEQIEGEEGYPGLNVAAAVSEILRCIGYDADPPRSAGDHGWEFEVRVKGYPEGCRVWCTLSFIGHYILDFRNTSWWDKIRKRHPPSYVEALRALGREMAADSRFSEVHWTLSPDDPGESSRALEPVDD